MWVSEHFSKCSSGKEKEGKKNAHAEISLMRKATVSEVAFAHFEVWGFFERGGCGKCRKKNWCIRTTGQGKAAQAHFLCSPTPPSPGAAGACGTAGTGGGGVAWRTNPHLFSGEGVGGVDCATDRRSDPAALFEQQVKGRAVPQCIVCLVVFGGVLADADGEGLND